MRHVLDRLLDDAPPGFAGWTLPVEPFLRQLIGHKAFTPFSTAGARRGRGSGSKRVLTRCFQRLSQRFSGSCARAQDTRLPDALPCSYGVHTYGDTLQAAADCSRFSGRSSSAPSTTTCSRSSSRCWPCTWRRRRTADRELSIVSAVFILPFLLFSGYAGQLADVYSKRTVLVVTKSLEIVAAGAGPVSRSWSGSSS